MRGDGASEDVDERSSHDERIVGDVNGFDFPLPEGRFLAELLRRREKVLLPRFRQERVVLHP